MADAEPDARFTLANERTYLAWTRTALALMAGGVALQSFADQMSRGPRRAVAMLLVALGVCCAGGAYARWRRVQEALRASRPLPLLGAGRTLGWAVAAVGVVLLFLL